MDDDVLGDLPSSISNAFNYSPAETHVKTYTAGEDGSRLALAAKEFGLLRQRAPRKQVRAKTKPNDIPKNVMNILLDPSFLDARMRAVWTTHGLLEDEEDALYHEIQASWDQLQQAQDPHAQGIGGNLTSAVLGIIKGMVGPAILYLPHGFATTGYVLALPILLGATVLYLYSSSCLLDSWKLESDETNTLVDPEKSSFISATKRRTILSYPELAYRALGSTGESMVKTGIALMQSGVCLTYLIFVPQNLHTSALQLFGWNIKPQLWLIVMVLIQIPLSWIRDIRKFTLTNLLANVLILYGLITCLSFAFANMVDDFWDRFVHLDPYRSSWFMFIGTAVLLFEGSITLLVPLQEAVQKPEDRAKFPVVYKRVILGIICFFCVFGIVCWMAFGDNVRTVLTTSLPAGNLATSVQFAYSIAVIFTFPLQNFPCLEIACRSISKQVHSCNHGRRTIWGKRNVICSFLVVLLAIVAAATMDSLDKVVSLMGSLLGCPIAFVFPPLIHSQLDPNISKKRKMTNYFVAGIGIVAMIYSSITTIMVW
jgi:proton-coupled amino acid transporter